MNGTQSTVAGLISGISAGANTIEGVELLVCPSFVFLAQVKAAIAKTSVVLGGQDLYTEAGGAYTGEISGAMLIDAGCKYVLVGHSERRALLGESNSTVARKFLVAQKIGLTPILCVGETLDERKSESTVAVISGQFNAVVEAAGIEAFANAVVAYEPVWAIGTGETATPEQAQEVHSALRGMAAKRSARIAADLRLLYGGSVKAANAAELFGMPDIDGGLVGGASLDADEFLGIGRAAVKKS